MAFRHFGVLTLAVACLLLVSSLSTDGDPDEEHNSDEHSEKGIQEGNIGKRSIKDKKSKKNNQNKNKNKNKPKKKNNKNKRPKSKKQKNGKPTTESRASCGFNDEELSTNGTNRSPWNEHGTWYAYRYVWNNGQIPYYFKGTVSNRDRAVFRRAMAQVQAKTCFRFYEKNGKPNYHHLEITVGSATCWPSFSAHVTASSDQTMSLHSVYQLADNGKCNWEGGILHELFHALGVGHTQKRKDRNEFLTVNLQNIAGPSQYEICQGCTVHPKIPYECNSIMHYGYATGRKKGNTGRTMTARNPNCCKIDFNGPSVATDNDWNLLKIIADNVCKASCTGTSNEWGCCSSSNPCQELQGDCDYDSHCAGSLVCGLDNCKNFFKNAEDAADCCIKPEALSFCANNWDGPLQYQCPSGQGISRMVSYHSNYREDRRWHFQCTKASFIRTSCEWSSYTYYDERIDYQCSGQDGVLVALESYHSNHREDRTWKFKCCSSNCFWSGWINWWDGYMNYYVPSNYHVAGLYSYHDNGREDRRWQVRLCRNPSNSRSSIVDDAEKERIRNSTMNISAEDVERINALFPSRCPQTKECLKEGGTCQKQNEEKEPGQGKEKGNGNNKGKGTKKGKGKNKGKGNGKGKGKGKRERKQQEHEQNLCKLGCKCMITI